MLSDPKKSSRPSTWIRQLGAIGLLDDVYLVKHDREYLGTSGHTWADPLGDSTKNLLLVKFVCRLK